MSDFVTISNRKLVRLLGQLAKAEQDLEDSAVMLADAQETAERILKRDGIWDKIERWKGDVAQGKARIDTLRGKIQIVIEDLFRLTGEKTHEVVSVVERHVYEIDQDAAFRWAKEKDMALKLDERAFKKLIDAGVVPEEVGRQVVNPGIRVAGNLEQYLPLGEDADSAQENESAENGTEEPVGFVEDGDIPF